VQPLREDWDTSAVSRNRATSQNQATNSRRAADVRRPLSAQPDVTQILAKFEREEVMGVPDSDNIRWRAVDTQSRIISSPSSQCAFSILGAGDSKRPPQSKLRAPDQYGHSRNMNGQSEPKEMEIKSAACYQLVLDRRLGEYVFPDGWAILGAGNPASKCSACGGGSPPARRVAKRTGLEPGRHGRVERGNTK
jgi:hypothetical protein